MKKKILLIIIFVLSFIMFTDKVKAVEPILTCDYGMPLTSSNKNAPWDSTNANGPDARERIKFVIYRWDDIEIDGAASYIVRSITWDNGTAGSSTPFHNVDGEEYIATGTMDGHVDDPVYFYASLYPYQTSFEMLDGKCPSTIKYKLRQEAAIYSSFTYHKYYFIFYNDDLDEHETPDSKWLLNCHNNSSICNFNPWRDSVTSSVGFDESEGTLVEKEYRDVDLDELTDPYGCSTYSAGLKAIEKSMKKVSPESCDNNVYFNQAYQELNQMCNKYKASSLYATGDDSDKVEAKACSKACTLLKDNVSTICKYNVEQPNCGSLGVRTVKWIFKVIRMVRYAVPALLILLSVIDYIKAIASDSEDEIKKVTTRVVKRLIASALVFIIPFILEFILNMFDIPGLSSENPFCAN